MNNTGSLNKMRIGIIGLLSLLSFGCQTLNYDIPIGQIELSNIVVTEAERSSKRQHKIAVSFDYAFVSPRAQPNMYTCTVQFLGKTEGDSLSHHPKGQKPCQFNADSGSVSFTWPLITDRGVSSPETLSKLALPIQYFVAVHQKTARNKTQIIAESGIYQSTDGN